MPTDATERELVLADNEQALIQDTTKGHVIVYVGPHKASLSETDQPVIYDKSSRRFERCPLKQSKQLFAEADEGSYIVLENPTANNNEKKPDKGNNSSATLQSGRKINVPGPVKFPTWPGQIASVIPGHDLKTNQYLIAKIYNDKAAEENWDKGVVNVQDEEEQSKTLNKPSNFAIGKLFIVPGTKASFYIPPTGIEVVPDDRGKFVREAVTLERLEYCVLLDESGDKRYEKGPAVIFPEPTEVFIEDEETGDKVFRAEELNHLMGIHLKVIAPYSEGIGEDEKTYKIGDELFITGKGINETTIYYPRNDHAIIKYGDEKIHYAIAIPTGEARYVLNRETGVIRTENGPKMFLPDPRKEVVIRRVLDPKLVRLLYPSNEEALQYNLDLKKTTSGVGKEETEGAEYVTQESYLSLVSNSDQADAFAKFYGESVPSGSIRNIRAKKMALQKPSTINDFNRKTKYTPPRMLTLETKYDGAVSISIWNGYAVMVVDKEGKRNVEIGPKTILLEYDQTLEVLELSTGKPKTTNQLLKTVYLRVLNNKISDVLDIETGDLCPVELQLSYRVNFEGEDHKKWFDVENYVKFLCDHVRSLLKREIKNHGIREFHNNAIDIIRNCILGPGTGDERTGRLFEENSMRIYDVEVLSVDIKDKEIANLLIGSQHNEVKQQLEIENLRRSLVLTEERERISIGIEEAKNQTFRKMFLLEKEKIDRNEEILLANTESKKKIDLADVSAIAEKQRTEQEAKSELEKSKTESNMALQETLDKIKGSEISREKMAEDLKLDVAKSLLENQISQIRAEAEAVKNKAEAISPDLIAALQAFGDKELAAKAAESMAPLAMIQKTGVMNILAQLLDGSPLASAAMGTVLANTTTDKIRIAANEIRTKNTKV